MTTITINESIFGDISCKGGTAMLVGQVIKETEKAVQIHYAIEPIFASGGIGGKSFATRCAWVPKSQIISDGRGSWTIKRWFVDKAMKSISIKPYALF